MGGFRDDSTDSPAVSEKRPAGAGSFTFQPGFVWKAMRTFWGFPDWHAAYLRQFEVLKRVDAKEKETILAERTLGEIRGLLGFVIGCGRLYHPEHGTIGFIKRCALAGQSIFDVHARSRNLHDRVANIRNIMASHQERVEGEGVAAGARKPFPYPLAVVLYHGKNPWSGPLKMSELIEGTPGLPGEILDFPIFLIDLAKIPPGEIRGCPALRALLLALRGCC